VALVVVSLASADSNSAVTALRNQISGLRKEERATIDAIKARYRAIKRRDRLTEAELRVERAEIRRQEDIALALTSSPAEREQIRKVHDGLRRYLTKGIRLEEREIRLLNDQEHALLDQVRGLYRARILQLEQEIHNLQKKPGKKR